MTFVDLSPYAFDIFTASFVFRVSESFNADHTQTINTRVIFATMISIAEL